MGQGPEGPGPREGPTGALSPKKFGTFLGSRWGPRGPMGPNRKALMIVTRLLFIQYLRPKGTRGPISAPLMYHETHLAPYSFHGGLSLKLCTVEPRLHCAQTFCIMYTNFCILILFSFVLAGEKILVYLFKCFLIIFKIILQILSFFSLQR